MKKYNIPIFTGYDQCLEGNIAEIIVYTEKGLKTM